MKKIIDLSHTIFYNMETYKGLPKAHICDYWTREESAKHYAKNTSFQIAQINISANTGTYVDVPFHRFEDGKDLANVEANALFRKPSTKVDCRGKRAIDAAFLKGKLISKHGLLIWTGWDQYWLKDEYYSGNHPYLTEDAADLIKQYDIPFVGIDSYNIDDPHDNRRIVHTILLGQEILIVEHMTNLSLIPDNKQFEVSALFPKFEGVGSFPVRIIAESV